MNCPVLHIAESCAPVARPDLSAQYQQTGESQYLISPMAQGDKHLQGRWADGEGLVVGAVTSMRAQGVRG